MNYQSFGGIDMLLLLLCIDYRGLPSVRDLHIVVDSLSLLSWGNRRGGNESPDRDRIQLSV